MAQVCKVYTREGTKGGRVQYNPYRIVVASKGCGSLRGKSVTGGKIVKTKVVGGKSPKKGKFASVKTARRWVEGVGRFAKRFDGTK